MKKEKNRIIVALDNKNLNEIIKIVKKLKSEVYAFKLGQEFFYNYGPEGYKKIFNISPRIFLDLKLHDIPNTVEKGIKAIKKLKPLLTTIHISGGDNMQKAAIKDNKKLTKILGVTILTSLDKNQTLKYYNNKNIEKIVKKFAINAKKNNLDGIVCSPLEIKIVRNIVGNDMLIIVPGIRINKKQINKRDDQKRIMTPKEAIKLGADYLVIGRPIIQSKNPLKTIKEINKILENCEI
tara:strand:+ start:10514 stop:11224 length:711 start_codon:yes stop_codon:yes gene_type:complete